MAKQFQALLPTAIIIQRSGGGGGDALGDMYPFQEQLGGGETRGEPGGHPTVQATERNLFHPPPLIMKEKHGWAALELAPQSSAPGIIAVIPFYTAYYRNLTV